MTLKELAPDKFQVMPIHLINDQTLVLCSGSFHEKHFNAMVIGWGQIGAMWNKPIIIVPVRPSRFTFEFMESFPDFTVSAFPSSFKDSVKYLGTHSGRNEDKLSKTSLTSIPSKTVESPAFAEAELIIECRKKYWTDLDPANFLDKEIETNYPRRDYHRLYFGEILMIQAIHEYFVE